MSFIDELKNTALKHNIEYINVIPHKKDGYNSLVVALLPYYAGENKSYFSKYTRGRDYHLLGKEILSDIFSKLNIDDYKILIDVSPENERELALKAGLGVLGKNSLVINEKYGSFVFILTAFINTCEDFFISEIKNCIGCNKCIDACPKKALGENGINPQICLSFITQKKAISEEEEKIIWENASAWGCDICQDVCPMNVNVPITPIKELKENLLLKMDDLDFLSNKDFKRKYGNFALSYKGKNILKRNISLIEKNSHNI